MWETERKEEAGEGEGGRLKTKEGGRELEGRRLKLKTLPIAGHSDVWRGGDEHGKQGSCQIKERTSWPGMRMGGGRKAFQTSPFHT